MWAQFMAVGRLTADPVVQTKNIGGEEVAVCNFSIACDPESSNKQADFYDCVAWRKQAENLAAYMSKGQTVMVVGRPHLDTWEKDGEKRSKTKYQIDRIKFIDRGKGKAEAAAAEDEIPF